jgi:hypothetical protein
MKWSLLLEKQRKKVEQTVDATVHQRVLVAQLALAFLVFGVDNRVFGIDKRN